MTLDRASLVFFDAACLIAGARSLSGGSSFLLSVCARGFFRGAVSQPVLLEAERNIRDKLPVEALLRFRDLLLGGSLYVAPTPDLESRRSFRGLVNEKDDHVVAAAVAAGASFLITLDRPLIDEVNAARLPLTAYLPGAFITQILTSHPNYSAMRE